MAKIFSRVVPEPGTRTNIYSHDQLHEGQQIPVDHPTGRTTATVTHDYGKAGQHVAQVQKGAGIESRNMGAGYYQIEID